MHRKTVVYIAAFVSVILFFSSCVLKNSGKPGEAGSVSADSQSESIEKPIIEKPNLLGDLTFVTDREAATSIVFNNKETILQVKDGSGLTWKLTIPSNALVKEETITMIPLKDVKGTNGGELSGVLLEPDGLKFVVPATLTVTGNGAEKGWIYSANQSGMNSELILTQQVDGGIESKISHFSSAVVDKSSPLSDPEKKAQIDADIKKAIAQVKKWLEDDPELPKPPTVKLECLTDDNFEEALKYREELFEEETAYLATLSVAYAHYNQAGDPMAEELKPYLVQLSKRAEAKVIEFFDKYSPDPERYYIAVMLLEDAAIAFASEFVLDGGNDHSDGPIDYIFERLLDWGKHTMDYLIDEIRTKHNYKLVAAACFVNRMLTISDINMFDKLIDAYTFKLTFDGTIIDDWAGGTDTWKSKGEAIIRLGDDIDDGEYLKLLLSGEGTGLHTDYSTTADIATIATVAEDFTFEVKVYPAPCGKEQALVEIDKFGPDELTYLDKDGNKFVLPSNYSYMWIYFDIFAKNQSAFSVVMDFESGEAEFEGELECTYETAEISYDIRLEHRPQ